MRVTSRQTLTVWFTEGTPEYICAETVEEFVLMKDVAGRVIGFSSQRPQILRVG